MQQRLPQGPGWFRDPWLVEPYRWWNGESWTAATWRPGSAPARIPNAPESGDQGSGSGSRGLWSLVLPIIGWVLNLAILALSNHIGDISTTAGLNERNNAGAIAFLVAAAISGLLGGIGILFAAGTIRAARSSLGVQPGVAKAGLAMSTILVAVGILMLLVGVFLKSLNGLTF